MTVQEKLVKRTKTMRGPILDDLNMPEKVFLKLVDVQMVGTPGGGANANDALRVFRGLNAQHTTLPMHVQGFDATLLARTEMRRCALDLRCPFERAVDGDDVALARARRRRQ